MRHGESEWNEVFNKGFGIVRCALYPTHRTVAAHRMRRVSVCLGSHAIPYLPLSLFRSVW